MPVTHGCDSAGEPTPAQAQAAYAAGIRFWGVYLAGPGATHNWSAGLGVLRSAGIAPLPIYVPPIANSGWIASQTPAQDADAFMGACEAHGITGAGVLDTEASMRGDPWTAHYTSMFCARLHSAGWADVCYAGGFMFATPPAATFIWWIVASVAPGLRECFQGGPGNFGGLPVDLDYAGELFPAARWTSPPRPHTEDDDMLLIRNPNTGEVDVVSGGKRWDIGQFGNGYPSIVDAYKAAGVALVVVEDTDGALFSTFPAA